VLARRHGITPGLCLARSAGTGHPVVAGDRALRFNEAGPSGTRRRPQPTAVIRRRSGGICPASPWSASASRNYPLIAYHSRERQRDEVWVPLLYAAAMGAGGAASLLFGGSTTARA